MLIYESETLGVLSISIESKDEDRIHLTVKYHDYEDKILDSASVIIDRRNNVIWIDGERDIWEELRKVIRENVVIRDNLNTFPPKYKEYLSMKGEVDHLVKFYKDNFVEEIHVKGDFFSWKFPNLVCFFEIKENSSLETITVSFLDVKRDIDKLLAFYYQHCKDSELEASKIFPNVFRFGELIKES